MYCWGKTIGLRCCNASFWLHRRTWMRRQCILLLNFTNEEWESLKTLRDADREERDMVADVVADEIIGALGMENEEMVEEAIDVGAV